MSVPSDRVDPKVWRIAATCACGPLMSGLDSTMVNVSLDMLGKAFNAPLGTIQWAPAAICCPSHWPPTAQRLADGPHRRAPHFPRLLRHLRSRLRPVLDGDNGGHADRLPRDDATVPRRLDLRGLALISPGLALLLLGLAALAHGQGGMPYELLLGIALLAGFVVHAPRAPAIALIGPRLFAGRTFRAAAGTQFVSNAINFGGQLVMPLYFLKVRGGRQH